MVRTQVKCERRWVGRPRVGLTPLQIVCRWKRHQSLLPLDRLIFVCPFIDAHEVTQSPHQISLPGNSVSRTLQPTSLTHCCSCTGLSMLITSNQESSLQQTVVLEGLLSSALQSVVSISKTITRELRHTASVLWHDFPPSFLFPHQTQANIVAAY